MEVMRSHDNLAEYTRKFTKITTILIVNRKLSKMECNIMFLVGFPSPLQDLIHHRLAIIKLDLYLDDPYPMDDAIAASTFLLTGSVF